MDKNWGAFVLVLITGMLMSTWLIPPYMVLHGAKQEWGILIVPIAGVSIAWLYFVREILIDWNKK